MMAEKLYRFEIERTQTLSGYVYAENRKEAENLILMGDIEFEQDDSADRIVSLDVESEGAE